MNIILHGASGRMGIMMAKKIEDSASDSVVAFVSPDYITDPDASTYNSLSDCKVSADCIVDFSNHSATEKLLEYAVRHHIPTVIATTGQTENELEMIKNASSSVPVFFSANMSVGIAVLIDIAKRAAAAFPDADIEIIEAHHKHKLDAPSGTAKAIFEALRSVREKAFAKFGRYGHEKRDSNEIGIHAVRAAAIVGKHEVIIARDSETITITHEAHGRELFADGALAAAHFIAGKAAGMYDMASMLAE